MSESERLERFAVTATAESGTRTAVTTRGFEFVVDEPDDLGGTNEGPNPVEYLLGAWAGCINVVAHTVADERDVDLHDVDVELEGELDPAAFMGMADDVRPGYQSIEVTVHVDADADEETLRELLAEVEDRCPVGDNIENDTPVTLTLDA
ncbi:OsmC family protein [Salinilacihabitans rarus]|uniref:OsmC family protein n=1 Tax=Salinilacihabitans rarus TaxID=2961596 RepID=UPI0020C8C0FB|nr:OsmC family protein [Salinilacihabitans rarus]